MDISEVRRRFTALIERPHGEFRLAEGALLIAQEEYPSLDVQAYLRQSQQRICWNRDKT